MVCSFEISKYGSGENGYMFFLFGAKAFWNKGRVTDENVILGLMAIHLLLSWPCVIPGVSKTTWCFWALQFLQLSLWFSWQMLKHRHSQIIPQWQHRCKNWKVQLFQLVEGLYWCSKFPLLIALTLLFFSGSLLWLRLEETESLAFCLIQSPINTPKKMCRSGAQKTMGILIIMGSSLFYG